MYDIIRRFTRTHENVRYHTEIYENHWECTKRECTFSRWSPKLTYNNSTSATSRSWLSRYRITQCEQNSIDFYLKIIPIFWLWMMSLLYTLNACSTSLPSVDRMFLVESSSTQLNSLDYFWRQYVRWGSLQENNLNPNRLIVAFWQFFFFHWQWII